jgi:hypothetical protein
LKFELGIAFAMLSGGVGILWLWSMGLSCMVVSLRNCSAYHLQL